MGADYTWVVTNMDCYSSKEGNSNVVFNVKWSITADDGSNKATYCGGQDIEYNPDDTFIQYENLTEEQVLDWVKNILGSEEINRITASLNAHLLTLANPPVVTLALPWA